MIRWCAYCQTYQGESAPFDEYAMTHTICRRCFDRGAFRQGDDLGARIEPIARFYRRIESVATGTVASADELLDEGLGLGIEPFDLLLGVLQPALYEVGERWARSEITFRDEHRLTALCATMVKRLEERHPELETFRDATSPEVILARVDGNTHSLGLDIVEFFLLVHGVRVLHLHAVSLDEIVLVTRATKPRILGLGVTMPEQLAAAASVSDRVADDLGHERPIVLFGGAAVRAGTALPPTSSALLCGDFRSLLGLLGRRP